MVHERSRPRLCGNSRGQRCGAGDETNPTLANPKTECNPFLPRTASGQKERGVMTNAAFLGEPFNKEISNGYY